MSCWIALLILFSAAPIMHGIWEIKKATVKRGFVGPTHFIIIAKSHIYRKKSRAVAKSHAPSQKVKPPPKMITKSQPPVLLFSSYWGLGRGAAEARVVEKRILKTTACGDHPDRIQWGYALLRYTVKSSQVVGLRDRVAIRPYAGYGDLSWVGR